MSHNQTVVAAVSSLSFHAAADIFPMLEGAEFKALTASIKANGLRESIRLQGGKILDGRARYLACQKLKLEPTFVEVPENVNPYDFVIDTGLLRRHLTTGQKALIGAKLATLPRGANQHTAPAACTQTAVAKRLGISVDTLQRATKVLSGGGAALISAVETKGLPIGLAVKLAENYSPKDQGQIIAQGVAQIPDAIKRFERQKTQVLAQPTTVGASNGKFALIYADPPWSYGDSVSSPVDPSNHYPTMSLDAIKAYGVKEIALKDAVLFLWAPSSFIPAAIQVMEAWGFTYITQAVWDKGQNNQAGGGYFLQRHETLLIGKRGKGLAKPAMFYESVIQSPRRRHSQKPDIVYDMLDKMYPATTKLELFSRNQPARALWTYDGNEATGGDELAAPEVGAVPPPIEMKTRNDDDYDDDDFEGDDEGDGEDDFNDDDVDVALLIEQSAEAQSLAA